MSVPMIFAADPALLLRLSDSTLKHRSILKKIITGRVPRDGEEDDCLNTYRRAVEMRKVMTGVKLANVMAKVAVVSLSP